MSIGTVQFPGVGLLPFGFYPYSPNPTAAYVMNAAYALENIYAAYAIPDGPIGASTTIGLKGAGMNWLSYTSGGAQGNDLVQFADGPYINVHAGIAVAGAATYGLDTGLNGNATVGPEFQAGTVLDIFMATGNQTNQGLTMKYWIGLFNINGRQLTASSDTVPATDFAAFRFSTAAGDSNWKCVTRNNATTQVQDSGVPVINATPTRYRLSITIPAGGSSVIFSINGVPVAVNNSPVPRPTQLMFPSVNVHKEVTGLGELRSVMFTRIVQRIGQ